MRNTAWMTERGGILRWAGPEESCDDLEASGEGETRVSLWYVEEDTGSFLPWKDGKEEYWWARRDALIAESPALHLNWLSLTWTYLSKRHETIRSETSPSWLSRTMGRKSLDPAFGIGWRSPVSKKMGNGPGRWRIDWGSVGSVVFQCISRLDVELSRNPIEADS
jgi:hypothetical protein